MSTRCCVEGCNNTNDRYPSRGTYYDGRFIRFPEHPDKRKIWNEIIGSNTILAKFICFEHFTDDDWRYRDIIMKVPLAKRKLKPNAVPSRKLPTANRGSNVEVAKVKEDMDEQTRKRLVAEALAEYDMMHSDQRNNESSHGKALPRRKRCSRIDEQNRKRLVAEALAAYETNHSYSNDNSSSNVKPPTMKKCRNIKARVTEIKEETNEQSNKCLVEEAMPEYYIPYSNSNDKDSSYVKTTAEKELCQNNIMQKCCEDGATDEMEIPVKECNFFENQTRKCGEVILDVDDQTFSLNCSLCPGIFLDFFNFSNHVLTQHVELLEKYNRNPLDANADDIKTPTDKQNDITNFYSDASTGIIPENILIDSIGSVDEMENKYVLDSENEECIFSSIEILPKVQNETNEINIYNQALVMQVICLLKQSKFYVIWNKTHPSYAFYKKRKEAITDLITSLVRYFPELPFTFNNIKSLLTQLRQLYIKELRRRQEANQNNELYICNLWCFNELKFLGEDFKIFKCLRPEESVQYYEQISKQHPLEQLFKSNTTETEQKTIEIIEEYEKHPALWNINHPLYRGKCKYHESLLQFQLIIQKKNPKIVLNEQTTLVQLLKNMHSWYTAEETLRQHRYQLNQNFQSTFPRVYAALEFLRGNVPPFKCKTCEKEFNIEYKYKRHVRETKTKCGTVKIDTTCECQYCSKLFATPAKLKHHLRTHTDERPYACQKCGKKFRTSCTLFGHKRIHNSKSFKCDVCERVYHTASLLRIHQKSHLGIRDKVCDICGKTFTNAQNLYRHQHLHVETPKFECKHCGKRFKQFACMFAHRQRCATLEGSKKRVKKNKGKAVNKLNKSEAESKIEIADQNQQSVEVKNAEDKDCGNERCHVDLAGNEPLYIHEDI